MSLSPRRWPVPSVIHTLATPAALIAFAAAALGARAIFSLRADPDLWGHVLFGRDIVRLGQIPHVDPYSFTSDKPWVNHEWLAEVAMYLGWAVGGDPGLVALKALIVLAAFLLVWRHLRISGLPAGMSWLLIGLIAIPAANRTTTFRPQVFSFLLFAALLALLAASERRRRRLWFVPAIFLVWSNTHGAWIVGAGSYAVWTASRFWNASNRERVWLALVALVAAGATLATPYGLDNWSFLSDTVGPSRPDIADWVPAWHEPGLFLAWLLPGAVMCWALLRRPRPEVGWTAVALLLGAFSLKVSRIDMFFGVAVAWMIAARDRHPRAETPREGRLQKALDRDAVGKAMIAATVGAVLLGPRLAATVGNLTCIPLDPASRSYPDAAAARFIRDRLPPGRLFVFFDYGEYAIWHLAGHARVSIDGRRETVYSDDLIFGHAAFFSNPAAHARYPERLGADHVWLPTGLGAAAALEAHGWTRVFGGPSSTVWTREPQGVVVDTGGDEGVRCFPGP